MTNRFAYVTPVSMDNPNEEFYVELYENDNLVTGLGPYASRETAEAVRAAWEKLSHISVSSHRVVCSNKLTEAFSNG